MPTMGGGYRDLSPLYNAWTQHYRAKGVSHQRTFGLVYKRVRKGKMPLTSPRSAMERGR
jgi:hypothetical protein